MSGDIEQLVENALKSRIFSACSIGVLRLEKSEPIEDVFCFGTTDNGARGSRVEESTLFDLASLTKPLVTALSVMSLVDAGRVALDDAIGIHLPCPNIEKSRIRISMLLSHSSGLPAHRPYFKVLAKLSPEQRKEAIISLILQEKFEFSPGRGTLYSDLGFILLGCLVERITGLSLAAFWETHLARPLGLQPQLFFPGPEGLESEACAVTGECGWSKRRLCGIVHDDNCRIVGGVAGHAGLFGTASGVLSMAGNLLRQFRDIENHPAYRNETLRKFLTRESDSSWTYGFDTPSPQASSCGRFFSPMTVGHLGFTGTSFWIDLEQGVAIVLLTNRVLMGDDPAPIRKFRPLLHDAVMSRLLE